jgi:hypothetical protein
MGSYAVSKFVFDVVKPKVHLFGHCHECFGAVKYSGKSDVYLVNAAQEMVLTPFVFDYCFE